MSFLASLASIASAAINNGSQIIGTLVNRHSQKETNKQQMALQQQQQDWNEYMWNKQNEYNSPINQMQLLHEAGLNPNMVYNDGSAFEAAGSPNPTQMPHLEAPQISLPNVGRSLLDSLVSMKQLDQMDANIDATEALARQRNADAFFAERWSRPDMQSGGIRSNLDAYMEAQNYGQQSKVLQSINDIYVQEYRAQHTDLLDKVARMPEKEFSKISAEATRLMTLNDLEQVRKEITELERDWQKQNYDSGLDPKASPAAKAVNNLFENWNSMSNTDKFKALVMILVMAQLPIKR